MTSQEITMHDRKGMMVTVPLSDIWYKPRYVQDIFRKVAEQVFGPADIIQAEQLRKRSQTHFYRRSGYQHTPRLPAPIELHDIDEIRAGIPELKHGWNFTDMLPCAIHVTGKYREEDMTIKRNSPNRKDNARSSRERKKYEHWIFAMADGNPRILRAKVFNADQWSDFRVGYNYLVVLTSYMLDNASAKPDQMLIIPYTRIVWDMCNMIKARFPRHVAELIMFYIFNWALGMTRAEYVTNAIPFVPDELIRIIDCYAKPAYD